jgi:menaquinol-cytochrome c reductase iron-sulfur subunit
MNTKSPENHQTDEEPKACSPEELSRRRFFARLSVILASLCALVLAIPGVGFVLAPLLKKTPQLWRGVGQVNDFKVGQTVQVTIEDSSPLPWAGVTAKTGAWLRRVSEKEFIAFAVNCSHLGCPVRWMQDANLFMCPCHGGVYYSDGSVAAGPPPQPLTRYNVRIQNGEVQLQTRPIPIT